MCVDDTLSFLDEDGKIYDIAAEEAQERQEEYNFNIFAEVSERFDGDASMAKNNGLFITGEEVLMHIGDDRQTANGLTIPGMSPERPVTDGKRVLVPNSDEVYAAALKDGALEYVDSREFGQIENMHGLGDSVFISGPDYALTVDPDTLETRTELPENVVYVDDWRVLTHDESGYTLSQIQESPYNVSKGAEGIQVTNNYGEGLFTRLSVGPFEGKDNVKDTYKFIGEGETMNLDIKPEKGGNKA